MSLVRLIFKFKSFEIFLAESDETPEEPSEAGESTEENSEETTVNCEEDPENPDCIKTGGGFFDQFFDASGSGDDSGDANVS